MADIVPTTGEDLPRIKEWIASDPFHKGDPSWQAEGLLTGNGILAFCVTDADGPLCFVRLDVRGEMLRLATQFGPEEEVSKKRLVVGLIASGIPAIKTFAEEKGFKGIVFESMNESLIEFMKKQGFNTVENHDYIWFVAERG